MLGNWRLLASVVVGTLVAGAILSATVVYADAIRDLGLEHALEQESVHDLDLRITQTNVAIRAHLYAESQQRIDGAVRDALGSTGGAIVRQGTSATFYPTEPGGSPDLDDPARARGNFRFRTNLLQHTTLTSGRLPQPGVTPDGAIEVLLGAATAQALGASLGDRLALHPFWDEDVTPISAEIVGLLEPNDLSDRYWNGQTNLLDSQTARWPTYLLFVTEEAFFGEPARAIPSITARYRNVYQVDLERLDSRVAAPVASSLTFLEGRLLATERLVRVETKLVTVLDTFDEKLFFVRIPLFVLLLQIGGVVAYYLLVVSTMLVERQAEEIATLRSRGATTSQLLAQYGVEAAILAALAVGAGPPLAALVIAALGPTPAFADLSGGAPLEVHLSGLAFALAGAGALIAFFAFMVPAWQATRQTVIGFKRSAARPKRAPLFLRYYLDVALVLLLAIVFWRLRREDDLFDEPLFGEPQADPFLLTTPAVAMLTAGIVFLRLFPLVLRLVAWLVARGRGVALLVGTRALARNPTHYSRLILMLMLATGVGMFGATFSATLDRSYDDRTYYAAGADARGTDLRALYRAGDPAFLEAIEAIPAEAASPLIRRGASINANGDISRIELLAVDPESFGEVAWFRSDFADRSLDSMLEELAGNATAVSYTPLPADARQFGMWAKMPDIRAAMDLVAVFRDSRGLLLTSWLGTVRPNDAATEEWRFFSIDLEQPRGNSGRASPIRLEPPIALLGVMVRTRSTIGAQRGVVLFGPAMISPLPPSTPLDRRNVQPTVEAFEGARLVHEFTDPGFEAAARSGRPPPQRPDPRRGRRAARLRHLAALRVAGRAAAAAAARRPPGDPRGAYPRLPRQRDGGAAGAGARRRGAADRLQRVPRSPLRRLVRSVSDVQRERQDGLRAAPRQPPAGGRERRPPRRGAGLQQCLVQDRTIHEATTRGDRGAEAALSQIDIEEERQRQEEDPLIAAGWEGILAISFAAVLLLSAIGFLIYSYLTAQQRRLEFAVLRTLGFSRVQIFGVVLLEHLFVVLAGMGLGTIVGLQVGRLMMDFFGLDERGVAVLPPFALAVSRLEVTLVWGILGGVFVLTVLAVVLLYARLALHRALRVGDA